MSWIDKLAQTYDLNMGAKGLIPLYHTEMNAHIIVTLNEQAEFVDARIITDKQERSKIIPCTENSSARTSKPCPYPLFDSLQYIAGDLSIEQYCSQLSEKEKMTIRKGFDLYQKELEKWCNSPFSNQYVCIVRDYVAKKSLAENLVRKEILPVDENGSILFSKPKKNSPISKEQRTIDSPIYSIVTGELYKAVVLFEIHRCNQPVICLWENKEVRESWQKYYSSWLEENAPKGLCQASGEEKPLAVLHLKRVCNPGDNSKIISGNDDINFTYRGRFENSNEAFSISAEISQKAHLALRWILSKQGCHEGTQYMVVWAVDVETNVPSPTENTADLLAEAYSIVQNKSALPDTAEGEAQSLKKLINGYYSKLNSKGLCFIVLDAATPGTLAIKLFRELDSSLYLKNVLHWHSECAWLQKFGAGKRFYGAPAPRDIAFSAYGKMKMDDVRIKSTVERLLPCILDGSPIPYDIAACIIRRASHFESVEPWEFEKNLGIACAIYRYNHQKRNYTMSLDKNIHSRDYLYGRLLATADCLEHSALSSSESNRPTNAMRLMAYFSEHPYSTWLNLEKALTPYKIRLASNHPDFFTFYEKKLEEIHQSFQRDDFMNDRPLSGEYLLGYYCQKADFYTKKENQDDTNN